MYITLSKELKVVVLIFFFFLQSVVLISGAFNRSWHADAIIALSEI